MATWSEFTAAQPRLAATIRDLVHQYGPGLGYLATVRADGGPRVHPVSPVITDEGLYCFLMNSPKRDDLERDGRYALHAFPPEDSNDEAYLSGVARRVTDSARVAQLAQAVRAEAGGDWRLYEFDVRVAMVARHREPTVPAGYEVWRDPAG
ncbi:MAG TPA: pyridoxamine 5'-phosphate oxidase family protein [Rugosimonospora sp.]|nr:pyridoxamine 5'-phosphate oxidase family protein [Rugosimonospora sp.]